MTPSGWVVAMLVTVSVLYIGAAVAYWLGGRTGMAIGFLGYVAANVGFILDTMSQGSK